MYAIADGTEVLSVHARLDDALEWAVTYTSGTVERRCGTWLVRGATTDDTLCVYDFDPEERDEDGHFVFAAERAAAGMRTEVD